MIKINTIFRSVFYGWWIVGASFLIWLILGGFIILGFTAFFEPVAHEFGWSYTQISLATSFRGAEVGLLAPILGLLVDRWGPRRPIFGGIILACFSLIFLSRINSLGMFYIGFALISISMSLSSPTVVFTSIANWFRKKLGIATAIAGSGFALGGLLIPLLVKLIDLFEWRMALLILGPGILLICLPFSFILRHKPEKYGYLPDGEKNINITPNQVPNTTEIQEIDIQTKQALRSRSFWHIGIAMMLHTAAIGTLTIHIMPYLSSISIPRSTAGLVAMAVPLLSILGRISSGLLSDRFNKRRVATIFFAITFLGLLSLSYTSSEAMWMLIPFVILFGIGWGSNHTLRTGILREYFGRSKFGSIFGFIMGLSALGTIAGPLFAGWVFDNWASYHLAWITFTSLAFVSVIIIATTPRISIPNS